MFQLSKIAARSGLGSPSAQIFRMLFDDARLARSERGAWRTSI
jgi:hypothetical protein